MSSTVLDWTITNFDKTDNPIFSPIFTIPGHPQIAWRLQLYPGGYLQDTPDIVSVYMAKLTNEYEAEIEFELSIDHFNGLGKPLTIKHEFKCESNRCFLDMLEDFLTDEGLSRSGLADEISIRGHLNIQVKNVRVIQVVELNNRLDATAFNWQIDNFLSNLNTAKLTSDKFTIPGHPLIKWQLKCYLNSSASCVNKKSQHYLSVELRMCTDDCEVEIEYQVVVNSDKEKLRVGFTDKNHFSDEDDCTGRTRLISRNQLDYIFKADATLKIQVKVFRITQVNYFNDYLNQRLRRMPLNLDSLVDFRLKTGDKTFDVHKFVLARESPYFRKMFENEFKEKEEKEVDLSQFQSKVIQEVLRFVYTGQLHNFDVLSDKIIFAADYFQMDYLKTLCQENMSFRISLGNCLQFLLIADQVNASSLKDVAMRFLDKNKRRFNKQALTKFFKEHAELGVDWMLWRSS